jgi:hypothetical protein
MDGPQGQEQHILSDDVLGKLVDRLQSLQHMSGRPEAVQASIDDVNLTLKLRTVRGRTVHAIDKKVLQTQRVLRAMESTEPNRRADADAAPTQAQSVRAAWKGKARRQQPQPQPQPQQQQQQQQRPA